MFLKRIYENTIDKQQRTNTDGKHLPRIHPYLSKNINVIGSVHNTRGEFEKDENYFAKSDIPQKARAIHDYITEFTDPDHLELKKPRWNNSVYSSKLRKEQREPFQRKLTKIRMGLVEGQIMKDKEKKYIYDGTDTRKFCYLGWNVSNDHHTESSVRSRNYIDAQKCKRAFRNTQNWSAKINNVYSNPVKRATFYNRKLRDQKRQDKPLIDAIKKQYLYQQPEAKQHKVEAAVFRLTYQHKLKQKQINQHNKMGKGKFRPNIKKTQKMKAGYKQHHSGKWQKFNFGKQDYMAWSCCMNERYENKGCVRTKVDKNGWNLVSY